METEASSSISEDRTVEGYEALEPVAQSGCEISIIGAIRNLSLKAPRNVIKI